MVAEPAIRQHNESTRESSGKGKQKQGNKHILAHACSSTLTVQGCGPYSDSTGLWALLWWYRSVSGSVGRCASLWLFPVRGLLVSSHPLHGINAVHGSSLFSSSVSSHLPAHPYTSCWCMHISSQCHTTSMQDAHTNTVLFIKAFKETHPHNVICKSFSRCHQILCQITVTMRFTLLTLCSKRPYMARVMNYKQLYLCQLRGCISWPHTKCGHVIGYSYNLQV